MSEFLTIEPAAELRGAFAVWALSRDPGVQTVGTHGFLIPLDRYPDVPEALLEGAYVDGYLHDRPEPVRAAAPKPVPVARSVQPLKAEMAAETRDPVVKTPRKRVPRKRAPRKPKGGAAE